MSRYTILIAVVIAFLVASAEGQVIFKGPPPGSVYREYSRIMSSGSADWRVTDPNIDLNQWPAAAPFVPNPLLPLAIDDLTDAVRAEAVITLWGGHNGTIGKKVRFNGNSWINLGPLDASNGIPAGHPGDFYMAQFNVTIDVPLNQLNVGTNYFEGTNAGQAPEKSFGWGQHGWYVMMIRVYYDPAKKSHPTGTITSISSRGSFEDNPTITANASGGAGVDRVDFLAHYDGYDTDGDGVFREYHEDYHVASSDDQVMIRNHVGTAYSSPWQATWNTHWVPDQVAGGVKFIARIRDNNGIWFVTDEVENLSLVRTGVSVRQYKPENVPESYWVKQFIEDNHNNFTIPSGDDLSKGTEAAFFIRSWNGINGAAEAPNDAYSIKVDNWTAPSFGDNHYYSYNVMTFSPSELHSGQNTVSAFCNSIHHGVELLWPGPAVMVRYSGNFQSPQPIAPTLASPIDNATNQLPVLTLRWNPAPTATSYRLQVSTSQAFSSMAFDDSTIVDTARQIGPLANMTTYYWRVSSKNGAGMSDFSAPRSFSTFVVAAAVPTPVSPANNASNVPISTVVVWHPASGASNYGLQVGTDSTFAGGLTVNDTTITDTTRLVTGLLNGTTYFWHVNGRNAGGVSSYSATLRFVTIAGAPGSPSLVFPPNASTNQALNGLTFRWNALPSAIGYRLQLGTDSTFTAGLIKNDSTIADTFRVVNGLSVGTKYYWRVNGRTIGGTGPYSPTWSFTSLVPLPAQVNLLTPVDQTVVSRDSVRLVWQSTNPASTKFWLEVAFDSSFSFLTVDSTVSDTFKTIRSLLNTQTYFWRVRGGNQGGWGAFSVARRFNVLITGVKEGRSLPTSFTLNQNYPNPFNPSTQIEFAVPAESHVKLEVYTILGEWVATLVDEMRQPGYYAVRFNAGRLSSGLYLYRLTTNQTSIIKKMLLMK